MGVGYMTNPEITWERDISRSFHIGTCVHWVSPGRMSAYQFVIEVQPKTHWQNQGSHAIYKLFDINSAYHIGNYKSLALAKAKAKSYLRARLLK